MPAWPPAPREITWDDLIPPGVPYSEIIGDGEMDAANDTWRPIYDENGAKLNTSLDGQRVKLPGYIIPMDLGADGVTSFVLVPYVGACIHVPPPPANQLVFVTTERPWPATGERSDFCLAFVGRTMGSTTGSGWLKCACTSLT